MTDYGNLEYTDKYKIKILTKAMTPKVRCWINKDWLRGRFDEEKGKSLSYDKNKSLEENIKLFYDKIKPDNKNLKNEVIINDKKLYRRITRRLP